MRKWRRLAQTCGLGRLTICGIGTCLVTITGGGGVTGVVCVGGGGVVSVVVVGGGGSTAVSSVTPSGSYWALRCAPLASAPVSVAKLPVRDDAPLMILNVSVAVGAKLPRSIASVPSSVSAPLTSRRSNALGSVPVISSASVPPAPCV